MPTKATIRRDEEILNVDVLECLPDVLSDVHRRLRVESPMGNDADGKLLARLTLPGAEKLDFGETSVFHFQSYNVAINAVEINL